jgi:Pirin
VSIRRGADRHQTRIGWLHGRHSFDTGIDPLGADTHHGVLVVSNHDTIAPRSGFETHPHRNMEIVTWVLNGSLVHQDSAGRYQGTQHHGSTASGPNSGKTGDARLVLVQPGDRARLSPQSTDGDLKLEVIILTYELNQALNCSSDLTVQANAD